MVFAGIMIIIAHIFLFEPLTLKIILFVCVMVGNDNWNMDSYGDIRHYLSPLDVELSSGEW